MPGPVRVHSISVAASEQHRRRMACVTHTDRTCGREVGADYGRCKATFARSGSQLLAHLSHRPLLSNRVRVALHYLAESRGQIVEQRSKAADVSHQQASDSSRRTRRNEVQIAAARRRILTRLALHPYIQARPPQVTSRIATAPAHLHTFHDRL